MEKGNFKMSNQITHKKNLRNILVLNFEDYGHYPNYLEYLIEYWCKQEIPGNFYILVKSEFNQRHPNLVGLAEKYGSKTIKFVNLTFEEEAQLKFKKSKLDKFISDFREWKLLCKYATLLKATQCLMLIVDRYLLPIAVNQKFPCPVSGIYYRPSLHYVKFSEYKSSWRDKIQHLRENLTLSHVMYRDYMKKLFVLDSFAVNYIQEKYQSHVKPIYFADPVRLYERSENQINQIREILGIYPGRQVFLLLGSLHQSRRGVKQLLQAVNLLPSHLCEKLCLLLVGKVDTLKHLEYSSLIEEISQSKPVQIITHYEFVSEQDVHQYFYLADVILATHQFHIGMSGTLVLASATQKPVLCSNYGLIGELVKKNSLGLTVDSTIPSEIALGLTRFLSEPKTNLCDWSKIKEFAKANSTEKFAKVIFENI
jgi:glycosyltransferase involved in cell wall biosynthesis